MICDTCGKEFSEGFMIRKTVEIVYDAGNGDGDIAHTDFMKGKDLCMSCFKTSKFAMALQPDVKKKYYGGAK